VVVFVALESALSCGITVTVTVISMGMSWLCRTHQGCVLDVRRALSAWVVLISIQESLENGPGKTTRTYSIGEK